MFICAFRSALATVADSRCAVAIISGKETHGSAKSRVRPCSEGKVCSKKRHGNFEIIITPYQVLKSFPLALPPALRKFSFINGLSRIVFLVESVTSCKQIMSGSQSSMICKMQLTLSSVTFSNQMFQVSNRMAGCPESFLRSMLRFFVREA